MLVPGIVWAFRQLLAETVTMLEGISGSAALRRSSQLVQVDQGLVAKVVFGHLFLLTMISLPNWGLLFQGSTQVPMGPGFVLWNSIATFFYQIILICLVLVYRNLRDRFEEPSESVQEISPRSSGPTRAVNKTAQSKSPRHRTTPKVSQKATGISAPMNSSRTTMATPPTRSLWMLLCCLWLALPVFPQGPWKPLAIGASALIVDLPSVQKTGPSEWKAQEGAFSALVSTQVDKKPLGQARPYMEYLALRYLREFPGDTVTTTPVSLQGVDAYRLDRVQAPPGHKHFVTIAVIQGLQLTYVDTVSSQIDAASAAHQRRALASLRYSPEEMLSLAVASSWSEVVGPQKNWTARLPGKPVHRKVSELDPDWECYSAPASGTCSLVQFARPTTIETQATLAEKICRAVGGTFTRLDIQSHQGKPARGYEKVTRDLHCTSWEKVLLIQVTPTQVVQLRSTATQPRLPYWDDFVKSFRFRAP